LFVSSALILSAGQYDGQLAYEELSLLQSLRVLVDLCAISMEI